MLVCSLNETIQWKRNGKVINNNEKIKISRNVLVVNSKDEVDYGEYFCELKNYKGKGINMRLIKVSEDDGDGESKTFLILFIVTLILMLCALVAISYLLLRRRPKLPTTIQRDPVAGGNDYGKSNEMFMSEISSGDVEEGNYNTLSEIRDNEPAYQSLLDAKGHIPQTLASDEAAPDTYEDVANIKDQNRKDDDHLYAEVDYKERK